jgi:hypothetical protein
MINGILHRYTAVETVKCQWFIKVRALSTMAQLTAL